MINFVHRIGSIDLVSETASRNIHIWQKPSPGHNNLCITQVDSKHLQDPHLLLESYLNDLANFVNTSRIEVGL